jgi:ABC-type transporter Mla MlaB component
MSPPSEATLVLPARLDAATAAALYRDWQPRVGQLAVIDMAAVASIDSAGVALVRQLRADAAAARGTPPLLHNPPPGYLQVCRAHRLAADGD